jgi:CarD family transcriptional regulator
MCCGWNLLKALKLLLAGFVALVLLADNPTLGPDNPLPAPPAEEPMEPTFGPGEMAVYPAQGVAEVLGIEEKEISGKKQRFFVLRIVDTDMRIMVPVAKAREVGLRQIISETEIKEVFTILREKEIHVDKQTWNRRYRGFMEKIKTGSLFEVAEVYRDLYRLKSTKTLSFGERRMLDTAKNLIVKELSVARRMAEAKMEREIERQLQS